MSVRKAAPDSFRLSREHKLLFSWFPGFETNLGDEACPCFSVLLDRVTAGLFAHVISFEDHTR